MNFILKIMNFNFKIMNLNLKIMIFNPKIMNLNPKIMIINPKNTRQNLNSLSTPISIPPRLSLETIQNFRLNLREDLINVS